MDEVVLHPAAEREYLAAIAWYRERSARAARLFVAEVERVVAVIAAHPDRYGWYEEPFHEAGLQRFPYSIIYRVEISGEILILAVAHTSREPGYWQDRHEFPVRVET